MNGNEIKITWKKLQTGIFDAYVDGEKTRYSVENGCLGFTGRDTPNFYIPVYAGQSLLKPGFGITLRAAKDIVEKKLRTAK